MTPKQIKALRTRLNMTQVEFAHKLDVQPVTVSRWERDDTKPLKHFIKAMEKMG